MNLIDRYILKQLVSTLLFALLALCVIFVLVHLLENLDDFIDEKATFLQIVEYYIHYLPEILKLLTPVATLVSVLFTVGRLSNSNEITAMKSGGLSLYRLMAPIATFALFLSFGQLYFNGWIVPRANEKKLQIEQKYLNKVKTGGPIYNLYFRDAPLRNFAMQYYNSEAKTGHRVWIDEYSSERSPRLTRRIEAETIIWDTTNNSWTLQSGIERIYSESRIESRNFDTILANITTSHNQIIQLKRLPDEMTLFELRDYIDLLKKGGKDVRQQMIDYYGQYAFPFANFIVVLFGVPFASIRKKGGIAIQMGAAMVISFVYMIFIKLFQTIGYSTDWNAAFIGWSANIVFLVFGLFVLFRTKT